MPVPPTFDTVVQPTTRPTSIAVASIVPFNQRSVRGQYIVGGRHIFPDMNASCPHYQAKIYPHEKACGIFAAPIFTMCRAKGEVSLPDLQPVPAIIDLLTGTSRQSAEFRQRRNVL